MSFEGLLVSGSNRLFSRVPLYESVVEWIAGKIRTGEYPTGRRLPAVDQLAVSLGVSRSSVREATRVLEAAGILKIQHGRGTYVRDDAEEVVGDLLFDPDDTAYLKELIQTRRVIEGEAARLAAMLRTEQDIVRMRSVLGQMREMPFSREQATRHDLAFHLAVSSAAHNRALSRIFYSIMDVLYEAIFAALDDEGAWKLAVLEHSQILTAIESQDPERAKELMTGHFNVLESKIDAGMRISGLRIRRSPVLLPTR